jgi:hypothetical protein
MLRALIQTPHTPPLAAPRPMAEYAQQALTIAQRKVPFSSNNPPYQKKAVPIEKAHLYDQKKILAGNLAQALHALIFPGAKEPEESLCFYILISLFAEAAESGNCHALAITALSHLIELQLSESVELMDVYINTPHGLDIHRLLVLNRDERKSDLQNPATWNNTILLDPWGGDEVKVFDQTSAPKMSDVALMAGTVQRIDNPIKIAKSFNESDKEKMLVYLRAAKEHLFEKKMQKTFEDEGYGYLSMFKDDKEFMPQLIRRFCTRLDEKIELFGGCSAKNFDIRPHLINRLREYTESEPSHCCCFFSRNRQNPEAKRAETILAFIDYKESEDKVDLSQKQSHTPLGNSMSYIAFISGFRSTEHMLNYLRAEAINRSKQPQGSLFVAD